MFVRFIVIIDESSGKILKVWNVLVYVEVIGFGGNEWVGWYNYGIDFLVLDVEENVVGCIMENDVVCIIDYQSQEE